MSKPVRRQGSAVYYARRAVPKDLREAFGKREIWKTLNTTDFDAAKPLERRQQLDVWSRTLMGWIDVESVGSFVQILQMYSYGVRPLRVFRRRAKL